MEYFRWAIRVVREQGIVTFVRRALRYLFLPTFSPIYTLHGYFALKLFNSHNRPATSDELLNFVFKRASGTFKPYQVRSEVLALLRILNQARPNTILEIGTGVGGLLFLFSRVAHKDATIISVDLPGGSFGSGYPPWRIPVYKSFPLPNTKVKIHLIRGNSHSYSTLERVKDILNNKELDFLFIDGDHTYEGVRKDFEMYSPLLRKNGVIAFHDIVVQRPESGCEVNRFWREIKDRYNNEEIVMDWNQKGSGIGLIHKH